MDFFFLYLDCVLFLTSKIKNNKIENVKKFINVKLNGAKLSIVIAPSKKGPKNMTNNLLFNKALKLSLKSFFQFYSSYNNLCFSHDHNPINVKVHESRLCRIRLERKKI